MIDEKRLKVFENMATGLRNELVMALHDFQSKPDGKTVHHLANVLSKVKGVLDESSSIKLDTVRTVLQAMGALSKNHAELIVKLEDALKDGQLDADEIKDIKSAIGDYKNSLETLQAILEKAIIL